MAEMKTLTINDIKYDIVDANAVKFVPQELTEEQKAQARENIGVAGLNPDCHAEYFQITDDGVVSLKPEYRGASTRTDCVAAISDMGSGVAGSKNTELPKQLVIPETVDGIFVDKLADGIFSLNHTIEYVVLPSTITNLPTYCFDQCWNLKAIYNTDRITSIGERCFQASSLERAFFPNLSSLEVANSFYCCGRLIYANIGDVESLPAQAFERCSVLHTVKSNGKIKNIGERAFNDTMKLRKIDSIDNTTSIGNYAFFGSRLNYDWSTLSGCTFGTNATSLQLNPTDFWSACTFTPCENPVPTHLSQYNPEWADLTVGNTTRKYSSACVFFNLLHVYCGLNNLAVSSPKAFENIISTINPNMSITCDGYMDTLTNQFLSLGINATHHITCDQSILQAIYDAIAAGGYACVTTGSGAKTTGHSVVIYGVNSDGEFMVIDSSSNTYDDRSIPIPKYSMHYKNFIAPSGYSSRSGLVIVMPS